MKIRILFLALTVALLTLPAPAEHFPEPVFEDFIGKQMRLVTSTSLDCRAVEFSVDGRLVEIVVGDVYSVKDHRFYLDDIQRIGRYNNSPNGGVSTGQTGEKRYIRLKPLCTSLLQ